MASPLPKVRRTDGRMPTYMLVILGGVIVALVAVIGLMLTGNLFSQEPKSDAERDYEILLDALKKNPTNPAVLMTLAEAEFDLGRTSDSFEHAEKASKLATEAAGINLRYAQLLIRDDRVSDAAKVVEKEIAISGDENPEAHFLQGQIFADLKKYPEAIKSMKKGLALAPQAADMRIVYGDILVKAGKKKEAIKEYQEALRFLPNEENAVKALKALGAEVPTQTESPHGQ